MIISLAGLDMYALAYVESRYIGAFVVLLLANLLSNIHRPDLPVPKMLLNFVSAIMLLVMAINIVTFNVEGFIKHTDAAPSIQPPSQQTRPPSCPGKVAEALNRSGIQPGDQVAIIGYGYDAFWARLARVKIVAEMLEWQADDCYSGDSASKLESFRLWSAQGPSLLWRKVYPAMPPWLAGIWQGIRTTISIY